MPEHGLKESATILFALEHVLGGKLRLWLHVAALEERESTLNVATCFGVVSRFFDTLKLDIKSFYVGVGVAINLSTDSGGSLLHILDALGTVVIKSFCYCIKFHCYLPRCLSRALLRAR